MFTCIVCMKGFQDSEKTDEHVFPDALGGMIHVHELCRACNSRLGTVIDDPLVNNMLIDMKRQILNLPGKKGILPNPLARGNLADDPDVEVYFNPTKPPGQRWRLRKMVRRASTAEGEELQLIMDAKDAHEIPNILQKWTERAERAGKHVTITERREVIGQRAVVNHSSMDMAAFQPGLLKIAYELAHKVLGPTYLQDQVAVRLRQVLNSPTPVEAMEAAHIRGTAGILGGEQKPQLSFCDNPQWLTGIIVQVAGHILCYINILNTFEANLVVSEHPDKYSLPKGGKVFMTDVSSKQTIEEYFYDWVTRLAD